ncbi:hypothetical protein GGF50DRAFT_119209 [Schizophyllum commune]
MPPWYTPTDGRTPDSQLERNLDEAAPRTSTSTETGVKPPALPTPPEALLSAVTASSDGRGRILNEFPKVPPLFMGGKYLSSKVAPAGRLSITQYPASYVDEIDMTDMTLHTDNTTTGNPRRTYKWYTGALIYPYRYGLHYTNLNVAWASDAPEACYNIQDLTGAAASFVDLAPLDTFRLTLTNEGDTVPDFIMQRDRSEWDMDTDDVRINALNNVMAAPLGMKGKRKVSMPHGDAKPSARMLGGDRLVPQGQVHARQLAAEWMLAKWGTEAPKLPLLRLSTYLSVEVEGAARAVTASACDYIT